MPQLVFHAAANNHSIAFWAESDQAGNHEHSLPGVRARSHPYDASEEQLRETLRQLHVPMDHVPRGTYRIVHIPTSRSRPIPSQPHLDPNADHENALIAPWLVRTLFIDDILAVRTLESLTGDNVPPNVTMGPSVTFWHQVSQLALALTARQQYVPDRRHDRSRLAVYFRPVWQGEFLQARQRLLKTAPPSANAVSQGTTRSAEPPAPLEECLNEWIEFLVDYLVFQDAASVIPNITSRTSNHMTGRTIDESFIVALTTAKSRRMGGDNDQRTRFLRKHDQWIAPLAAQEQANAQLAFSAQPPPDQSDEWTLRVMLVQPADAGRIRDAQTAWEHDADDRSRHRTVIRSSLKHAASVSSTVARLFPNPNQLSTRISGRDLLRFASREAPRLADAGYPLETPAGWPTPNQRPNLTLSLVPRATPDDVHISLDDILQFDWRASLDGKPISQEELQLLADSQLALVKIQDAWIDLTDVRFQNAVRAAHRRISDSASLAELILFQAAGHPDVPQERFEGVALAEDRISRMLATLRDARIPQPVSPIPQQLHNVMRDYQRHGSHWIDAMTQAGWGVCLADDMGLGKTLQTLAAILAQHNRGETKPALIIAPTSTIPNWLAENSRFTPQLGAIRHHGPNRPKSAAELGQQLGDKQLVVTSYATAQLDQQLLATVKWSTLVLDEAQNVKNPQAARTRACRAIPAQRRIALTGTPVQNHAGDLRSILDFANPGLLSKIAPPQGDRQARTAQARTRLRDATAPFILRRLKSEPAIAKSLPERITSDQSCLLTTEQAALYRACLDDLEKSLRAEAPLRRAHGVLQVITRLKQICNHPAHFLREEDHDPSRSGKLTRLFEILEEIQDNSQKAVVFTDYTRMARILQLAIADQRGRRPPVFHGKLTADARQRTIDRFSQNDDVDVLIVTLRAGGAGINLTAANHVVLYDRWWNPAVEAQAADRVHRIGQTQTVHIHRMLCAGTLEQHIARIIEAKTALSAELLNDDSAAAESIAAWSDDQLRQALSLTDQINAE